MNQGNLVVRDPGDIEDYPATPETTFVDVPAADVTSIEARLYAGNDKLNVADDVKVDLTAYGGAGTDTIRGGGGVNHLYGYGNLPGNADFDPANDDARVDNLHAGVGLSFLYGQKGGDWLYTHSGAEQSAPAFIYGGEGDDGTVLMGHLDDGKASVFGEAGNDSLTPIDKDAQWTDFSGGSGFDEVTFWAWDAPAYVDLRDNGGNSGPLVGGQRTLDLQADVEGATGSDYDDVFQGSVRADTFYGDDGNDTFYGGDGSDHLYGEGGNDRLFGEKGNDFITGGKGADLLVGGAGNDTLYAKEGFLDFDTVIGGDLTRSGGSSADTGHDIAFCDVFDTTSGIDVLK